MREVLDLDHIGSGRKAVHRECGTSGGARFVILIMHV